MNFKKVLLTFLVLFAVLVTPVFAVTALVNQDSSPVNPLVCSASGGNIDDYVIRWNVYVGGSWIEQKQFENQYEIDISNLEPGDNWRCDLLEYNYDSLTHSIGTALVSSASAAVNNAPVTSGPFTSLSLTAGASPTIGTTPLTVSFTSATSGGAPGYTYVWDFTNDGTVDVTAQNPSFTYGVGIYIARVRVSDSIGNTASITIQITVLPSASNNPPSITSSAVTSTTAGVLYNYDVNAADPDGNVLTYSLTTFPSGMTINSATGLISWTPSAAQAGNNDVVVSVTDGIASVTQSFVIDVFVPTGNITILPDTCSDGTVDEDWQCDIDATAVPSGTLEFSLINFPTGMSIDRTSGLISWTPSSDGNYDFTVRVIDTTNVVLEDKSYSISIDENLEDISEFVFIDSIVFEKETYAPGETAIAYVTVRNEEDFTIQDLKLELLMETSGIKATSAEFNLGGSSKKTIKVSLDLPASLLSSSEWIKVTLLGDNIRIARYRAIEYSGSSVNSNEKSDLIFKPTSLPGYVSGNKEQKLNWVGVWFVVILFLLLLVLAVYIVKKMAEENQKRDKAVSFTALDNGFRGD